MTWIQRYRTQERFRGRNKPLWYDWIWVNTNDKSRPKSKMQINGGLSVLIRFWCQIRTLFLPSEVDIVLDNTFMYGKQFIFKEQSLLIMITITIHSRTYTVSYMHIVLWDITLGRCSIWLLGCVPFCLVRKFLCQECNIFMQRQRIHVTLVGLKTWIPCRMAY